MKTREFSMLFVMVAMAAVFFTSCSQDGDGLDVAGSSAGTKRVSFAVGGDFEKPQFSAMTRSLEADGKAMTDLWVLDYVGGQLVQQVHQTANDENFGVPEMSLTYGEHHVYFVASRGTTPVLSTDAHTITWAAASDTFYKDFAINMTRTTSATQSVTLQRVATRLRLEMQDAIAEGVVALDFDVDTWYRALDYLTGQPVNGGAETCVVPIPESVVGQTGKTATIYGLSGATEWTTDFTVTARDIDGGAIASVTVTDAPMKANRVTKYSGRLFGNEGTFSLTLASAWDEDYNGNY